VKSCILLPIARSEVNRFASPHVLHDVLNAPGLVLVALGIVGLEGILVFHVYTLLQALSAFCVVLIRIRFGVVRPHPFGKFGCSAAWVELDFVPISVLEKFSVGETELLGARITNEAVNVST
jgi:hypothetical protein